MSIIADDNDFGQKSKPEKNPVVKAEISDCDRNFENCIRPKSFDTYIGQTALKDALKITIQAAKKREKPLDHLLFYGPPGLGKTTLAGVIAQEMGVEIKITSAPALERPRDIIGILMSLQGGEILFIDEIHRLNKVAEEILYPAMEDFYLDMTTLTIEDEFFHLTRNRFLIQSISYNIGTDNKMTLNVSNLTNFGYRELPPYVPQAQEILYEGEALLYNGQKIKRF